MLSTAIVGYGYVGQSMEKLFPESYIYNEGALKRGCAARVNEQDVAIICVPTPENGDGECDTSIVEYVVRWVRSPFIVIKSTVPPGTTDRLARKYKKKIVFSPEFVGEGSYWIPEWKYLSATDPSHHPFQVLGGDSRTTRVIYDLFLSAVGPTVRILQTNARNAEAMKYCDNIYGAMKVVWANEMFEALRSMGVDYRAVRELFLNDPRMSEMHTAVYVENRGYGGKCYPKDLSAFIQHSKKHHYQPKFLEAIDEANKRLKALSKTLRRKD